VNVVIGNDTQVHPDSMSTENGQIVKIQALANSHCSAVRFAVFPRCESLTKFFWTALCYSCFIQRPVFLKSTVDSDVPVDVPIDAELESEDDLERHVLRIRG